MAESGKEKEERTGKERMGERGMGNGWVGDAKEASYSIFLLCCLVLWGLFFFKIGFFAVCMYV